MREFIKVMKALSDPNRVKMVKLLQNRTLCVCEIKEILSLAQSTASKHLKILEAAGFITFSKEGLWVNYRLADGAQSPYVATAVCRENIRAGNKSSNNETSVSRVIQRRTS